MTIEKMTDGVSRWGMAVLVLGLVVAGCGRSGHATQAVSGQVTLDGKPIAEGRIVFVPENTSLGPEAGKLVDGKYAFRAKEGNNRVEIMVSGIGPNPAYVDGIPLKTNIIPERYNEQTELRAEVTSDQTTFDFALSSQ